MSRTGEDRGRATGIHPGLGEMVAWAAAYVLCDLMVRHLALAGSHIVLWYPAAGVTLAWLVRAGIRGAPILIAARSMLSLWPSRSSQPILAVVLEATLVILIYAGAAGVIRPHLTRRRPWSVGACSICLVAMLGAPLVAALVGSASATLTYRPAAFGRELLAFWLGDATGVLLLAPPLMMPWRGSSTRLGRRSLAGHIAFALAAIGLDFALQRRGSSLGGYLWFLPLAWAAQRHGVRGAVLVNAVYAAALTASAIWFPLNEQRMFSAQILLLTLAVAGLLIGATRSEAAENDARYWHLLATANEGIWRLDVDGRTLYMNARMCEILGVSEDEVMGRLASDFIAPEALPAWQEGRKRRMAGEPAVYETSVLHSSGARRNVLVSASPAKSAIGGAIVSSIATVTDVTELRDAQAAQQALEARRQRAEKLLETVFRTSPDAMILFRAGDELIIDVNEAWCRTTGYGREQVVGRSQRDLKFWKDPADSERLAALIREHGSVAAFEFAFNRRRPDGSLEERVASLAARPAPVDGATYVFGIGRDVTVERRHEREKQQLRRLEELGRLAGGIAHDFNNLLAVISYYSEEARRRAGAGAAVSTEDMDQMLAAVERGRGLTGRLLNFSRNAPAEPRCLDLNQIIEKATGLLKPLLGNAISLEFQLDPALPPVLADPGQVEQLLLNLVVNARDAMPEGGRIRVRTRPLVAPAGEVLNLVGPDVEPGEFAVVEVIDEGVGISDEVRARIFEPFFTTKQPGRGTGLGLAVVHGIVRQARGAIRVESGEGQGTVFRVFWPASESHAAVRAQIEAPEDRAKAAPLILLVEDDPPVRNAIQRMLEAEALRVVPAANGVEALQWLEQAGSRGLRVSLVVSDVRMPLMDGPALARRLFQLDPRLPVLLITGHAEKRDLVNLPTPACGLLQKPFSAAELSRAIRACLAPKPVAASS